MQADELPASSSEEDISTSSSHDLNDGKVNQSPYMVFSESSTDQRPMTYTDM